MFAYAEATVPKITLIIRKAYGGAYVAMNSKAIGADLVFAWPNAEIAVMGPEGAASILYEKEIKASADRKRRNAKKQLNTKSKTPAHTKRPLVEWSMTLFCRKNQGKTDSSFSYACT